MKPGDVYEWLDQGPAILLKECTVPAPCLEEELGDYLVDPQAWPQDSGWTIKLLGTGEILDVHAETLEADFPLKCEGILRDEE